MRSRCRWTSATSSAPRSSRRSSSSPSIAQIAREAIPPAAVLDHDHRDDDGRHDAGRLRRPLAGHRLRRRHVAAARPSARRRSCSGIARSAPSRSTPSARRRPRCSTGSRSCSRRRWAPRSATGRPTRPASATAEARSCFGAAGAGRSRAYYWTTISRTVLFWAAFILTRPLGAVVGDFLDKPLADGGLALSRFSASAALLAFIVACTFIFPQRAATQGH